MFRKFVILTAGLAALFLSAALVYQIPWVHVRASWRLDLAMTYLRGVIYPAENMPRPDLPAAEAPLPTPVVVNTRESTRQASPATPIPSATPAPTLPPLPPSASLPPPAYERQDMNDCGPATLSLYLRMYGWKGTQYDISALIKPQPADRNVNVEELVWYVRTRVGWLSVQYRVGGTIETLKRFLAAGIPVVIEETFKMDAAYWPHDDLWAGHYLLLTGYNDAASAFITQDTYYGANRTVDYNSLDRNWEAFNRVFILVYRPDQEEQVKGLLGPDWDVDTNRQRALQSASEQASANPQDAFAWFNAGTNLVYFERYDEAAHAYDTARAIGLPQRMLRYQFGPFIAYFHAGRIDDLMALTEYALQRTPNSEEALVWRGWALYRKGDVPGAAESFRKALQYHPDYQDAVYGLNYIGQQQ